MGSSGEGDGGERNKRVLGDVGVDDVKGTQELIRLKAEQKLRTFNDFNNILFPIHFDSLSPYS